ncbi:hypothetical protein B0H15DRAFT_942371 [Mycena belliarum]|uniref:CCHC-type domain-containing protein n=1 Tax=Mycena belliarum TaxID=1033014 RepID=A0AAD6UKV8_9AGAR|nr:hypothetical protein B0H15DRAFT_942371 [Mycena belliae]
MTQTDFFNDEHRRAYEQAFPGPAEAGPSGYRPPTDDKRDTWSDDEEDEDHFDRQAEHEKCELILNYCSVDVQNVIYTLDTFEQRQWSRLKRDILRYFDAERAVQKYKPADVEDYVVKMRSRNMRTLTQWRKYYIKYNIIAGGPLQRGHLSRGDYNEYFWIGINRSIRPLLENRVRQSNLYRGDEQYTVAELNEAGEWYFRRNKYASLLARTKELGEDEDDEYSDEDTDSDAESSDEEDSDYEAYRRRKRQREKRKKEEVKKKARKPAHKVEHQKYEGNEDEVAGMIRKLNAMSLDDPDYTPNFYKVMALDKSGVAEKLVRAPPTYQSERIRARTPNAYTGGNNYQNQGAAPPATWPNNIPLGSNNAGNSSNDFRGCFGCLTEGHRMMECPHISELIQKRVVSYNDSTRRLTMIDGADIRRRPGESLVKAAERIAGVNTPRVMFGMAEPASLRRDAVHKFYQVQHAHISDEWTEEEPENEDGWSSSSEDLSEEDSDFEKGVYLTAPQLVKIDGAYVQNAERTVPSTRAARRQAFDGVYPPAREKTKAREVRDLQASPKPEAPRGHQEESPTAATPSRPEATKIGRSPRVDPVEPSPEPIPIEARRVRFNEPIDEGRRESREKDKPAKKKIAERKSGEEPSHLPKEEDPVVKPPGRQSALAAAVDKQQIMDRILDTQVPLTFREILATSKDLRTEMMDLIRVKNVKAVLLGNSRNHPAFAALDWPRSDGTLIKVEMETGDQTVCAIIDTGSQLDVVRADVAALKIRRTVDMQLATNMSDANGGSGQLQGWIKDVEFKCGGATTTSDLWVSQKAPFELLLGRPWQRGNLVSIDEREEGTYLIFKDRETRRPRYELLAVPYEGPVTDFHRPGNHYQSFALIQKEATGDSLEKCCQPSECGNPLLEKGLGSEEPGPWAALTHGAARIRSASAIASESERKDALKARRAREGAHTPCTSLSDDPLLEEGLSQAPRQYKREEEREGNTPHYTLMDSALTAHVTVVRPPTPFPAIEHSDQGLVPNIQYLSRRRYHHPHAPTAFMHSNDPVAVIDEAVREEWNRFERDEPASVDPSFSAAPQSVYFGSAVLPDGQRVHYHVALNNLQILKNKDTNRPFSIAGHTLGVTIESTPEGTAWNRELFYPIDSAIREEMNRMAPGTPLDEFDVGFPVHSTSRAPPLPPALAHLFREERAPLEGASSPPSNSSATASEPDSENVSSSSSTEPTSAETEAASEDPWAGEKTEALVKEIEARADRVLYLSDSDSTYSSLPDLVSLSDDEYPAPGPETFHANLRTCAVCLGPQHALADCPQLRTEPPQVRGDEGRGAPSAEEGSPGQSGASREEASEYRLSPALLELMLSVPPVAAGRIVYVLQLVSEVREAVREATRTSGAVADAERSLEVVAHELAIALRNDPRTASDAGSSPRPHVAPILTSLAGRPSVLPRRRLTNRFHWTSPEGSSASPPSSDTSDTLSSSSDDLELYAPAPRPATTRLSPILEEWIEFPPSRAGTAPPEVNNDSASFRGRSGPRPSEPGSAEDETNDQIQFWLSCGELHQADHLHQENDVCGAPLRHVVEVLYGPLRDFIDFAAMDLDGWARFRTLSSVSMGAGASAGLHPTSSDPTRHATRDTDPLPTLPRAPSPIPSAHVPALVDDRGSPLQGLNISEGETTREAAGSKRKTPSDENLGESQEGPRKKLPSLADPANVQLLAGSRRAILEGFDRLDGLVWHRYDVRPRHIYNVPTHHPLLTDVEVIKLRALYAVLFENFRYELASLVQDVLAVVFKPEYALPQILNTTFLDRQRFDGRYHYWELLPPPTTAYHYPDDDSTDSSDYDLFTESDFYDLQYPDFEFRHLDDQDVDSSSGTSSDSDFGGVSSTSQPAEPRAASLDETASEPAATASNSPPSHSGSRSRSLSVEPVAGLSSSEYFRRVRQWEGGDSDGWTDGEEVSAANAA